MEGVVRKLDASRQELAVAAVQLQMTRWLPSAVVEAVGHGGVAICGGCARLLCPTEAR